MNVTINLPVNMFDFFRVQYVDVIADGALWFGSHWGRATPFLTGEFPSATNVTSIIVTNTTSVFSPDYARFFLFPKYTGRIANYDELFQFREGNATLQYPTAGQFGLAISFYQEEDTKEGSLFTGFTSHTALFIPIISSDTLDIQRNNALTLSLTLFILMFAAIEVHADTKPPERRTDAPGGQLEEP
jgi:hypothetical protein